MPPRSLTLAAVLLSCATARARAVMCLKPGSLGPDVPNCTAYQEGLAAKTVVSDNLVAVAGDAAAESFEERQARDAAGAFGAQRSFARAKATELRSSPAVPTAPAGTAPSLGAPPREADQIAGEIVRGTGNAFQALGPGSAPLAGRPPAPGAPGSPFVTPAAAAPTAASSFAGAATPMRSADVGAIGATIADPGRSAFDNAAAGLSEDVAPAAAARAPTVRQCTILHPCANAD